MTKTVKPPILTPRLNMLYPLTRSFLAKTLRARSYNDLIALSTLPKKEFTGKLGYQRDKIKLNKFVKS